MNWSEKVVAKLKIGGKEERDCGLSCNRRVEFPIRGAKVNSYWSRNGRIPTDNFEGKLNSWHPVVLVKLFDFMSDDKLASMATDVIESSTFLTPVCGGISVIEK